MEETGKMDGACGPDALKGYYRLHARIYDATRWTFLFGRSAIVSEAERHLAAQALCGAQGAGSRTPGLAGLSILEAGCGTGRNLGMLARRFPGARIVGVDLCPSMLAVARRRLARGEGGCARVELREQAYDAPVQAGSFDLVLFSYALSMFNPGFEQALDAAFRDLKPGGLLAVVDFHDTPARAFERWMGMNHVRMQGHLLSQAKARFEPLVERVVPAFGGLWRYLSFIGSRPGR
ncbi:Methyltransferase type 11 [Desulfovibrio sp. X2]|uniref:class I SAM-dependent methyltransferase n=1 Tax=Desulfovibrio sp. X2 TaxID=941449 RepID=UPI00035899D1|nr:class I SAM-dependent methyltransferase [Desulfovibrio sp. X2]EPR44377.1 Methyltransferase type 11 [Desulfovibrio sp. X2]